VRAYLTSSNGSVLKSASVLSAAEVQFFHKCKFYFEKFLMMMLNLKKTGE
jgi:hypothetical protein